VEQGRLAWL